ncbi:unnamed protein product [Spirodela intermedia]|uniref:Uncharacterized protein n=1 Tax=Spirodela intermedia TaxID=51605 RepID=A0A7I8L947_SPIIN|nr:unnamed protein product [Spirodela intermedia]
MTRVRSHPWTNAITNPPTNTVSPDILPTTSPVFVSLSKKPISCLKMAFKYIFLILAACLSPVTIQQVTSEQDTGLWEMATEERGRGDRIDVNLMRENPEILES